MLKNFALIAAIAATLGACSATARESLAVVEPLSTMPAVEPAALDAAPAANDEPIAACDLRAQRTENGVRIQGRAFAETDIQGEYQLSIVTSGANESEISQAGDVAIAAGRHATFGESEISLARGSHLRAVLTLRDANGLVCRETLTL